MAQEFWPLARRDEGENQGARGITNAAERPKEQARLHLLFVYSDLERNSLACVALFIVR